MVGAATNERAPRAPVFLMADLDSECGPAKVKLRNVSSGGALVEGADLPRLGMDVIFARNGVTVTGMIVWRDGKFAGVRFDAPVDVERILRTINRPAPIAENAEAYRRPGFRSQPLTIAEQEWGRRMTSGRELDRDKR